MPRNSSIKALFFNDLQPARNLLNILNDIRVVGNTIADRESRKRASDIRAGFGWTRFVIPLFSHTSATRAVTEIASALRI
jgi:hypothetical protein